MVVLIMAVMLITRLVCIQITPSVETLRQRGYLSMPRSARLLANLVSSSSRSSSDRRIARLMILTSFFNCSFPASSTREDVLHNDIDRFLCDGVVGVEQLHELFIRHDGPFAFGLVWRLEGSLAVCSVGCCLHVLRCGELVA